MTHDLFISHAAKDKTIADAVCAKLEQAGIRCWIAPRDVHPGRPYSGQITRAIKESGAFLLILSGAANLSEHILREVELAANSRLSILQFRIEDAPLSDDLKYYLSMPHWLDAMTPPLESHLAHLEKAVRALLPERVRDSPPSAETDQSDGGGTTDETGSETNRPESEPEKAPVAHPIPSPSPPIPSRRQTTIRGVLAVVGFLTCLGLIAAWHASQKYPEADLHRTMPSAPPPSAVAAKAIEERPSATSTNVPPAPAAVVKAMEARPAITSTTVPPAPAVATRETSPTDTPKINPGLRSSAGGTVKVGVLHSLSGTMAISETSLRDVLLFTFDEINAAGGVMGKKIDPVVVDGASIWPLFAQKAKQLLEEDKVAVTFGCWTSVSRKAVLPVFEKNNGLLFYPVQYEGEEFSKNIFYTAETVNQQATPAVDYHLAQGRRKFYLLGSDYAYSQATNLVLLEYLQFKGVPLENIGGGFKRDESGKIISAGKYTLFGHTDYQQIIAEIKQFAGGGKTCVINTLNGDTNVPFFKEYAAAGLTAETCPVVSLSISEDEFRGLPARHLIGQLGAWTYFQSIKTPANSKFVGDFQAWVKKSTVPGIVKTGRVTCSPMVLSYDGVYLWKAAVEKAGSFDVEKVIAALESGVSFDGPGGRVKTQKNHHLTKNVYIGATQADGQFRILKEYEAVLGEPFLQGKVADFFKK